MLTAPLYAPADADDAYAAWSANCGPAAFAALLRRPVMSVREFFPAYPARPWTNPTHMKAALDAARVRWDVVAAKTALPGLVFIQLLGPWCDPGVPVGVAYRNTHWVAVSGKLIYDVNGGDWLDRPTWERGVMARVLAHTDRATGWEIRTRLAVEVQS